MRQRKLLVAEDTDVGGFIAFVENEKERQYESYWIPTEVFYHLAETIRENSLPMDSDYAETVLEKGMSK